MNYLGIFLLFAATIAAVADSLTVGVSESKRVSTCQKIKQYRGVLPVLEKFWKYLIQKYSCEGKPSVKKQELTCGLRKKQTLSISLKIAGGRDVIPDSWPWQVSLFMAKTERLPDCVGTLIADRWVATSGICIVANRRSMKLPQGTPIEFTGDQTPFIRVGDNNLLVNDDYQQTFEVSKVILHPNFKETNYDNLNDIALLRLKGKVSLSDRINVACLPDQRLNFSPGTKCTVLGWGMKARGNNLTSISQLNFRLQEVEMPLISHEQCRNRLIRSNVKSFMHVCAGGENGKGTRAGDTGAPLLCPQLKNGKKHWYLYGINSFEGGYAGKTYEVYTRVSSYSSWIERMLRLHGN